MQAILLAAGMGRRLGPLTAGNTKCMLEVNGVRLVDRVMDKLAGTDISRIVVVAGYESENLKRHIISSYPELPVVFIENKVFDKTNNIYSLWLARDYLREDDTLLLESDLIFDDSVIDCAIHSPHPNVALVAKYEPWMDGTMVCLDDADNIVSFIPKSGFDYSMTDKYYKTVNVYKLSREFSADRYLPFLEAYIRAMGNNEYYEQVLRVMTMIDTCGIKAVDIGDRRWYEIDDVQDLRIAETIFAEPALRLDKIQKSYGGYWRYSSLLDFCYLVNPFFPPKRMFDEMKANFDILVREYPSGMDVNSLLAAKYFGIERNNIVVGNGAAELIKELIPYLGKKIGYIVPTFEEYANRFGDGIQEVKFCPEAPLFRYTADDLMDFFSQYPVDSLILINPDNPSGNFIPYNDLLRLIEWTRGNGMRLIVDESFVDFATGFPLNTLLRSDILAQSPHLTVLKSISKSYGVPGLRLGVLASGNPRIIEEIARKVAIWNINSVAEFYMQIFGKYEAEYAHACELYAAERDRFLSELNKLPALTVVPSQANFILCRLNPPYKSHDIALRLLTDFDILIKDCTGKRGFKDSDNFIRIAVRDRRDNDRLLDALIKIFV